MLQKELGKWSQNSLWTEKCRNLDLNVSLHWCQSAFQATGPRSVNGYQWVVRDVGWISGRGRGGGDNLASIQIQGEVVIFLVALWQGNQDKLWLGRPLGLSTDLTFLTSHLQHSRDQPFGIKDGRFWLLLRHYHRCSWCKLKEGLGHTPSEIFWKYLLPFLLFWNHSQWKTV